MRIFGNSYTETMSIIFRMRMLSDEDDCFLRDYEVPADFSLNDFHAFIRNDLRYSERPDVTFFTADENWNRLREFGRRPTATGMASMEDSLLSDVIRRYGDRLIYRFDPAEERAYYLETVEALHPQPGERYPRVMFSNGAAPDQFDPEKPTGNRSIFDEAMDGFDDFGSYDDTYGEDE